MKKLMMVVVVLLATTAAGTAAQTAAPVDEVRITRPLVRIELPQQRHNLWANEFDTVKGLYHLSNGKKMELSMWGNRMYASIDGMPRTQLIAATPYSFVARDAKLQITIDENDPYGPRGAEVVLAVPRLVSDATAYELTRLVAHR